MICGLLLSVYLLIMLMNFVSGLTFLNTFVNYSRYLCKEFELVMLCVNIQTRWIDQATADLEGNISVEV